MLEGLEPVDVEDAEHVRLLVGGHLKHKRFTSIEDCTLSLKHRNQELDPDSKEFNVALGTIHSMHCYIKVRLWHGNILIYGFYNAVQ